MHTIDKEKFGEFVARLRREKGLTQKELAQKLYISDKAVSKWERGASIPDTDLLLPLAELLGVPVEALLSAQNPSAPEAETQKEGGSFADRKSPRAYEDKSRWPHIFGACVLAGAAAVFIGYRLRSGFLFAPVGFGLAAVFGAYFCFFAPIALPAYYDTHRCGVFYDGPFRMNMPGVAFNNKNWPHILRAARIWSCAAAVTLPVLEIVALTVFPAAREEAVLPVFFGFDPRRAVPAHV